MDLTPGPQLLEAYRTQNHSWGVLLGELIDNAFDAGASQVVLRFPGARVVEISDDGNGCSNIQKMLTLGAHFRQQTTKLGRYGVGLKEAACCLWGTMTIETAHRGVCRHALIDWQKLAQRSEWTLPDATEMPAADTQGTRLKFERIQKNYPSTWNTIADDLGFTFFPAIASGRQIRIETARKQPIVCAPYQMPPFCQGIDVEFEVAGKSVRLRAGVVQENHMNRRPGFAVVHAHRVIGETTAIGAFGYSVARIAGILDLGAGWTLSKNKTSIVSGQDELAEAMHIHLLPLLEAAQRQAMTITGDEFNRQLNALLSTALHEIANKTSREKRASPENDTGAVEPKNSGKKRTRARKVQPGDRFSDAAQQLAKGGKIDWRSFSDERFGEVDLPGNVIWLNDTNKTLLRYRDADNSDAVLNVAVGLWAADVIQNDQRDKFPQLRSLDHFSEVWSKVLSSCALASESMNEIASHS